MGDEVVGVDAGSGIITNIILSLVFVAVLLFFYFVLSRMLLKSGAVSKENHRRTAVTVRNLFVLLFIVGLIAIWAREIQTFIFSLVAFAVALTIATKELILCVTGSFFRTSARSFSVGDYITVGSTRGVVLDTTLFSTTLLEVGPGSQNMHTGRAVVLPNSIFLNTPVINETFAEEFTLHIFSVPVGIESDWEWAVKALEQAAYAECRPFLEEARGYIESFAGKQQLDTPSVEPRITLQFVDHEKMNCVVRIVTPSRRKERTEQAIIRRYLAAYKAKRATEVEGLG